ncbi:MAG: ATPase [Rhodobacteraceae bacterium]|nr:ATPase [Paracoccaceae bacterium]
MAGVGGWAAKRFWKTASATREAGGHGVALDGRPVRTPAKAPLVVPTRSLAEAIAGEWQAQGEAIDPRGMPLTRAANAAIDKVTPQFDEVAGLIAAYGGSDLLCYRAETPEALIRRQAEAWDPGLDWAEAELGARLGVAAGIVAVAQPADGLARLAAAVRGLTAFELTALYDLVALSGSLVLGLAVARGALDPGRAWDISRIDETWQIEQWGEDDEAAEVAALKRGEFLQAHRFLTLARAQDARDDA